MPIFAYSLVSIFVLLAFWNSYLYVYQCSYFRYTVKYHDLKVVYE